MSIPHLFRCPISLDLFTDPVTLSTGQTYDRPSIEKWLGNGNSTCPVTMQRLDDTSLVPNHTLRVLIDQWLLSVPDPNSRNEQHIKPTQATGTGTEFSLSSLKQKLQSQDATVATKINILKKVRILSIESDVGHATLIKSGYFPLLLQMIFSPSFVNPELVEIALDCVLTLSPSTQSDSLNMLKMESNLASYILLFEQGNVRIKTSLCSLIETISTQNATRELCLILGQSRRVLQVLVSFLHNRNEAAVRALSGICSVEANRANAIKDSAIDGLVAYLTNSSKKDSASSIALATLDVLVGVEVGKKALMKNPNAVRVLVKFVFRVSSKDDGESEHAIGALSVLCCESWKARAEAVNAGVLTQVLLLMQSQCGCKAKVKARALLKLLRSMWDKDPCVGGKF